MFSSTSPTAHAYRSRARVRVFSAAQPWTRGARDKRAVVHKSRGHDAGKWRGDLCKIAIHPPRHSATTATMTVKGRRSDLRMRFIAIVRQESASSSRLPLRVYINASFTPWRAKLVDVWEVITTGWTRLDVLVVVATTIWTSLVHLVVMTTTGWTSVACLVVTTTTG